MIRTSIILSECVVDEMARIKSNDSSFFHLIQNNNVPILTGSPLMYQDSSVGGLDFWALHIKWAVSPTLYSFLPSGIVLIFGPSFGKSKRKEN